MIVEQMIFGQWLLCSALNLEQNKFVKLNWLAERELITCYSVHFCHFTKKYQSLTNVIRGIAKQSSAISKDADDENIRCMY